MTAPRPGTRIEILAPKRDARGEVYEPLDSAGLMGQRNVHVVTSRPGAVRGNHLHRHGTEVVTVPGPALVRIREDDADRDVAVPAGAVFRFTIPPGVAHAIRNDRTDEQVLVSFNTVAHDPAAPDVERVVLLE